MSVTFWARHERSARPTICSTQAAAHSFWKYDWRAAQKDAAMHRREKELFRQREALDAELLQVFLAGRRSRAGHVWRREQNLICSHGVLHALVLPMVIRFRQRLLNVWSMPKRRQSRSVSRV